VSKGGKWKIISMETEEEREEKIEFFLATKYDKGMTGKRRPARR